MIRGLLLHVTLLFVTCRATSPYLGTAKTQPGQWQYFGYQIQKPVTLLSHRIYDHKAAVAMATESVADVLALERQTWDAFKRSGADLIPYLAKDCCMIFPESAIFSEDGAPTLLEILIQLGK